MFFDFIHAEFLAVLGEDFIGFLEEFFGFIIASEVSSFGEHEIDLVDFLVASLVDKFELIHSFIFDPEDFSVMFLAVLKIFFWSYDFEAIGGVAHIGKETGEECASGAVDGAT